MLTKKYPTYYIIFVALMILIGFFPSQGMATEIDVEFSVTDPKPHSVTTTDWNYPLGINSLQKRSSTLPSSDQWLD